MTKAITHTREMSADLAGLTDEDPVRERCSEHAAADRRVALEGPPPDLGDRLERLPGRRSVHEVERPCARAADARVLDGLVRELRELGRERARLVLGRHEAGR